MPKMCSVQVMHQRKSPAVQLLQKLNQFQRTQRTQDVCCTTTHPWEGGPLRAPVPSPPAMAFLGALSPGQATEPFRRFITRGRLRSPCTHRREGVPAPKTPDHFMETRKGAHRRYPYLGTIPATKGPSCPCGTLTNPSRIGCRPRVGAELEECCSHHTSQRECPCPVL